jgi:acyl carrier protein/NADP-dependent 3-hydroxy acid dehydrogenase YdfG
VVLIGQRSFDGTDRDGALARARELIWAISATAHAVVGGWHGKSPQLWLVARNGLVVHGDEPGDPAIGALKGLVRTWEFPGEFARVIADEPDLDTTLVDLDTRDDVIARLITELESPAGGEVIAWRGQRRYVERLTRATLPADERDPVARADGSYIVTGGLGGLGMIVVRWLVDSGAGRVVLNGRTEPSAAQRHELAELEDRAQIVFAPGDIASSGVAERLVAAAEESGLPLRGVVHAAGVINDGLVAALTREGLERVWAPKAAGALRLHEATATARLDWWVGFSSMAVLLGLPGQAAYACANAWLDALVAWRRAAGLPATAINWGQWSDVGIGRSLTLSVVDPITPAEGVEALTSLVGGNTARVGVGRLRLDRAAVAAPEIRETGYFTCMLDELDALGTDDPTAVDDRDGPVSVARDWSQMSVDDMCVELGLGLRSIMARELHMPASTVDMDQPFPELGLDSMMAMTVLREARRFVGIELSATMLWNHPTISALAASLSELIAPQQGSESTDTDATLDSADSVLDALFDSIESASAGSESGI